MNRRKLLTLLGIPAVLGTGSAAWASISRSRNPYYQGPVTENFNGTVFTDGRT